LKTGQFTEQQRARFLALEDDGQGALKTPGRGRLEILCVLILVIAGIAASAAVLGYALLKGGL